MKFAKKFFADEYFDGFFVDSRMKRYWAASIETLEEIDKVCKRNNITWYADWGTLLGAVRHGGFIPWDDDIDIAMKRADYERFLKVAQEELPEHYIVRDSNSEQYWIDNAASVLNWDEETYVELEKERLIKYHGCPFRISIDVFPLDYMYRNKQQEKIRDDLLMDIWYVIAAIDKKMETRQIIQGIKNIENFAQIKLPDLTEDNQELKKQLRYLSDTIMQICTEEEADELVELRWYLVCKYTGAHFKKEWYENKIYIPFNGFQMPVPEEYHKVLAGMYGDYMTPVRGTASHSYPKYKKELEFFDKWRHKTGEKRSVDQMALDMIGNR